MWIIAGDLTKQSFTWSIVRKGICSTSSKKVKCTITTIPFELRLRIADILHQYWVISIRSACLERSCATRFGFDVLPLWRTHELGWLNTCVLPNRGMGSSHSQRHQAGKW